MLKFFQLYHIFQNFVNKILGKNLIKEMKGEMEGKNDE